MTFMIALTAINGLFAMILLPYGISVLKNHSLNRTTNENLRGRWNGHPENKRHAHHYINESSQLARMKYILTHELPDSKLHKVLKLNEMWKSKFVDVDLNETINFGNDDKCTFDELL